VAVKDQIQSNISSTTFHTLQKILDHMKTKIFLLVVGAAVVTLSFTFASTSRVEKKEVVTTSTAAANAPAGGFALEDK
jgi:hypothetical protein